MGHLVKHLPPARQRDIQGGTGSGIGFILKSTFINYKVRSSSPNP
jgi:hypothetical protein